MYALEAVRVQEEWLRTRIVQLYKRKGEPSECNNSRKTSLWNMAGKVYGKVLA